MGHTTTHITWLVPDSSHVIYVYTYNIHSGFDRADNDDAITVNDAVCHSGKGI